MAGNHRPHLALPLPSCSIYQAVSPQSTHFLRAPGQHTLHISHGRLLSSLHLWQPRFERVVILPDPLR